MNDLDLGARIREAAPDLAPLPSLADHRGRILREARARRGRRLRRWGAGAAASVFLASGASMAMAGGGNETPWGWVADNVFSLERTDGSACFQGLRIAWDGLDEDDPIVVDAKAIVSGIDLESLDTSATEAALRAEYAHAESIDGEPMPLVVSADELTQQAVFQTVAEKLWTGLDERGHTMWPGHEVSLSAQSTDCR